MNNAVLLTILMAYIGFILIFLVFYIICMWKIYVKAGQDGWACLIPIYSTYIYTKIIGKPWWWTFLLIIPYVNIVFMIWGANLLSKKFGKSEGFTVGLIFLGFVFYPILAFGEAKYEGNSNETTDLLDN
jgi:hypothetical protein